MSLLISRARRLWFEPLSVLKLSSLPITLRRGCYSTSNTKRPMLSPLPPYHLLQLALGYLIPQRLALGRPLRHLFKAKWVASSIHTHVLARVRVCAKIPPTSVKTCRGSVSNLSTGRTVLHCCTDRRSMRAISRDHSALYSQQHRYFESTLYCMLFYVSGENRTVQLRVWG